MMTNFDIKDTGLEKMKTSPPPSQYMESQVIEEKNMIVGLTLNVLKYVIGVMVSYHCCIPPKIGILWVIYLSFCDQILTFSWL